MNYHYYSSGRYYGTYQLALEAELDTISHQTNSGDGKRVVINTPEAESVISNFSSMYEFSNAMAKRVIEWAAAYGANSFVFSNQVITMEIYVHVYVYNYCNAKLNETGDLQKYQGQISRTQDISLGYTSDSTLEDAKTLNDWLNMLFPLYNNESDCTIAASLYIYQNELY